MSCFSGTKEFFIEMGQTASGPWSAIAEHSSSDPNIPIMAGGVLEVIPISDLQKVRFLQYRCTGSTTGIFPYCGLEYIQAISE